MSDTISGEFQTAALGGGIAPDCENQIEKGTDKQISSWKPFDVIAPLDRNCVDTKRGPKIILFKIFRAGGGYSTGSPSEELWEAYQCDNGHPYCAWFELRDWKVIRKYGHGDFRKVQKHCEAYVLNKRIY